MPYRRVRLPSRLLPIAATEVDRCGVISDGTIRAQSSGLVRESTWAISRKR